MFSEVISDDMLSSFGWFVLVFAAISVGIYLWESNRGGTRKNN